MSSGTPLVDWLFLIGEWIGTSKDQFGREGEIVTTNTFSLELGEKFILGKHETKRDGVVENQHISMMFYDARNKRFVRKTAFSYGFLNNEAEYERSKDYILFEVTPEPSPQAFDGMRWKSYIRKISETEIRDGLEVAKDGEDFTNYGDAVLKKVT